jgi:type III pantothenate kinase
MMLAIDIGNTTIMVGMFKDGELTGHFSVTSAIAEETGIFATVDEIGLKITGLIKIHNKKELPISDVAICSVVPDLTQVFCEMARKYLDCQPWLLDHTAKLGLNIKVDQPEQVGPDRLANAVAAKSIYGAPAVVVDLGTATTFDVVNRDGDYIGGAIAPGVLTSSAELFRKAARLFPIQLEKPAKFIGGNTVDSMKSGIFHGTIGMIDYLVTNIIGELKENSAKVIATGGLAGMIAPHSKTIQEVDRGLTLKGIKLAFEMNK